jgi:hypothetical protein
MKGRWNEGTDFGLRGCGGSFDFGGFCFEGSGWAAQRFGGCSGTDGDANSNGSANTSGDAGLDDASAA